MKLVFHVPGVSVVAFAYQKYDVSSGQFKKLLGDIRAELRRNRREKMTYCLFEDDDV